MRSSKGSMPIQHGSTLPSGWWVEGDRETWEIYWPTNVAKTVTTGLMQGPVSENTIESLEDDTEYKLLSSTHAHSGKQNSAHITNIHITQVYILMQK